MRTPLFLVFLFLSLASTAQVNVRDSASSAVIFDFSFGYFTKHGEFTDYFMNNMSVGAELKYKFSSNWIVSAGGRFQFADGIRNEEKLFAGFMTRSGSVLNLSGEYANVTFNERGFNFTADVSRVFSNWGHNANSGPMVTVGAGYITHFIELRNPDESTPQIQDEYKKGYDRKHHGLVFRQFLGYMYADVNQRINFTAGFEFMQGFTRSVRGFNYDTRAYDTATKLDLYFGLRISWFLPLYFDRPSTVYYY